MNTLRALTLLLWKPALLVFTFVLGVVLGVVLKRPHKKRVSVSSEEITHNMNALEKEVDGFEEVVATVWATRLPAEKRPHSQQAVQSIQDPENLEGPPALVRKIIELKLRLASLRRNLENVIPWFIDTSQDATRKPHVSHEEQNRSGLGAANKQGTSKGQSSDLDRLASRSPRRTNREEPSRLRGPKTKTGLVNTSVTAEIVALYNRALIDTLAREQLREQYQPTRVGTVNAVERRQNPTIKAEFREATDGDFFAFGLSGDNQYLIVPRLGVTIEAVSFSAGALGEVFSKTQNHDPKLFYSHYSVVQPAIFERKDQCWELLEAGELDLGPGD